MIRQALNDAFNKYAVFPMQLSVYVFAVVLVTVGTTAHKIGKRVLG